MPTTPTLIASDLEGVLVPEVWIAVAEQTGIESLRVTTRDIPDYDQLMRNRLRILQEHGLRLADIQAVIERIDPLPGAVELLDWARSRAQVIILSDTFSQFAAPLMRKLGNPTIFCNALEIASDGRIVDYHLRLADGKQKAVAAFKALAFHVIAMGDSYNDTSMLRAADVGILFRPSAKVIADFPQFPVIHDYTELRSYISQCLGA